MKILFVHLVSCPTDAGLNYQDLYIRDSSFVMNEAKNAGGAIALGPKSSLFIDDTEFVENVAKGAQSSSASVEMGDAIIWSSYARAAGDKSVLCTDGISACWGNADVLHLPT